MTTDTPLVVRRWITDASSRAIFDGRYTQCEVIVYDESAPDRHELALLRLDKHGQIPEQIVEQMAKVMLFDLHGFGTVTSGEDLNAKYRRSARAALAVLVPPKHTPEKM